MITLKQLSELSGLSIRTVSRILNGQPHVVAEKRDLVLRLAAEHQYVPNMAARNLRLQKRRFVGILCGCFSQSATVQKLNVLDRTLLENGYYPVLGRILDADADFERMLSEWAGAVDYVVVANITDAPIMKNIYRVGGKLPLKFIFLDCGVAQDTFRIPIDREGSICDMLLKLSELGYRNILHCGKLPDRIRGVKKAQDRAKPGMRFPAISAGSEFDDGYAMGEKVLKSGADVVFFDTDRMAAGFYRYAAEHAIGIPDEIAVVGFDNDEFAKVLTPTLSTLAHPLTGLAERVLDILETGKSDTAPLPMEFLMRESVRH